MLFFVDFNTKRLIQAMFQIMAFHISCTKWFKKLEKMRRIFNKALMTKSVSGYITFFKTNWLNWFAIYHDRNHVLQRHGTSSILLAVFIPAATFICWQWTVVLKSAVIRDIWWASIVNVCAHAFWIVTSILGCCKREICQQHEKILKQRHQRDLNPWPLSVYFFKW